MTSFFKSLLRLLGSLSFTFFLLSAALISVAAGTFIESYSTSHRIASHFTYENPLFTLIFAGFFVNILSSAMLRFPFRKKHVPFLLAHLGLLMIFTGVIVKKTWGIQGSLRLIEGGVSGTATGEHGWEVVLESREGDSFRLPLNNYDFQKDDLIVKKLAWLPHAVEKKSAWEEKEWLHLQGMPPLPYASLNESENFYPLAADPEWQTAAIIGGNKPLLLKEILNRHGNVIIDSYRFTLSSLFKGVDWDGGKLFAALKEEAENFSLVFTREKAGRKMDFEYPLTGFNAHITKNISHPHLGVPLDIEARFPPTLLFVKDEADLVAITIDRYMHIDTKPLQVDQMPLYIYEKGFQGYTSSLEITPGFSPSVQRSTHRFLLFKDLASKNPASWPEPLQWLHAAATELKLDVFKALHEIFHHFEHTLQWVAFVPPELSPTTERLLRRVFENHPDIASKARVASEFFSHIPPEGFRDLSALKSYIDKKRVPLSLDKENLEENLYAMTETLFSLPAITFPNPMPDYTLFSAVLRLFKISLGQLKNVPLDSDLLNEVEGAFQFHIATADLPHEHLREDNLPVIAREKLNAAYKTWTGKTPESLEDAKTALKVASFSESLVQGFEKQQPPIHIESPIFFHIAASTDLSKPEDEAPGAHFLIRKGNLKETFSLAWKPGVKNFKKPILNGQYLALLRPRTIELPLKIALKQARSVFYPGSSIPYSYEADLQLIGKSGKETALTLSMNEPWETEEGLRIYLAGISKEGDGEAKKIHLVISSDPAKQFLTYPGCFFISLGTLLLLFRPRFLT